ncbi:isocitrate lyase/PEP mutase family protein [Streptosporangium pseudovulgare]|uniref:2-methylisocitrate lyase n=1 Tax=Streptosporangium pseudovulgare TaxID=35765 RepID=A0ABQ2R325_9ACTN|nr:isocitrate lyase/phosphoenolpyruvate mutase family protein [Streptosporangium pseudovulgare]GGQ07489.1 2-methylisocitrate lyase [Streptosporangium pseudovulgare]
MKFSHRDRALRFRESHTDGRVLVLPTAWDVASACLIEDAGADAIATTSAGVAWSLGAADGNRLGRDRALDLVARIVSAVDVPVTADIEGGYASDPDGVAETVREVLAAGAVGINIEDGHAPVPRLRPVGEQCERITAARRAADAVQVPMFLNARVDTYLLAAGDPATRLRDTVDRAVAYVAAGADGIFVPGVTDPETVSALVREVPVPLNIMAGPGAPTIGELAELGVGRVSLGPAIALATHALVRRGVRELLTAGTYTAFAEAMDYGEVNALVDRPGEAGDRPLPVENEGARAQ